MSQNARSRSGSFDTYLKEERPFTSPKHGEISTKNRVSIRKSESMKFLGSEEAEKNCSKKVSIDDSGGKSSKPKGAFQTRSISFGNFEVVEKESAEAKAVRKKSFLRALSAGNLSRKFSGGKNSSSSVGKSHSFASRVSASEMNAIRCRISTQFQSVCGSEDTQKKLSKYVNTTISSQPLHPRRSAGIFTKKQLFYGQKILGFLRNIIRAHYLMNLSEQLPTLSPIGKNWPPCPMFLLIPHLILQGLHHSWRCRLYRNSFHEHEKLQMNEKLVASQLFRCRKTLYESSVSVEFVSCRMDDLLFSPLQLNLYHKIWMEIKKSKNICEDAPLLATVVGKMNRRKCRFVNRFLLLTRKDLHILDFHSLKTKVVLPLNHIHSLSASPWSDDVFLIHLNEQKVDIKTRQKGDYIFSSVHLVEIVSKIVMAVEEYTKVPLSLNISASIEFQIKDTPHKIDFVQEDTVSNVVYERLGRTFKCIIPWKQTAATCRHSHEDAGIYCKDCQYRNSRLESVEKTLQLRRSLRNDSATKLHGISFVPMRGRRLG